MHILEPHRYDRVRPLLAGLDDHLAVAAILDGAAPGQIYVDDPDHPTAAFTWTRHRFFLAGSPENASFNEAIRRLFAEVIYPQAPAWGLEMFELKHTPEGWAGVIPGVILRDQDPILAQRHYYVFRELKHDWRTLLPQGYRLASIDADLLAQRHIRHLDDLKEELCSERPSVEDFLAQSFGIAALYGDELAGWCTSEYNSGDCCEVGIGTLAPHQRRGVATALGSAFVERAQTQGVLRIGWHCWANNAPSIATALKLGYQLAAEYTTYIAWFAEADNLTVNGNEHLHRGEYALAMSWYRRAIERGIAHKWTWWAAARAAAALGESDAALAHLGQAINLGFDDLERIKASPQLMSLHETEGWKALVRRLEGEQDC